MFKVWNYNDFRATKDIDLLGKTSNSIGNIRAVFSHIISIKYFDGIEFSVDSIKIQPIQVLRDYNGMQVKAKGKIDKSQIHIHIDIGFADIIFPKPISFSYPTILNMKSPKLYGYTVESVIAEKVHAILSLGEINSRMKDFYDIWFLSKRYSFNGTNLTKAILSTFDKRKSKHKIEFDIFSSIFMKNLQKHRLWNNFCLQNDIKKISFENLLKELQSFLLPLFKNIESKKVVLNQWLVNEGKWS